MRLYHWFSFKGIIAAIFISCIFIFSGSCKKDNSISTKTVIEHDTVKSAWQQDPIFNYMDQNIHNAGKYQNTIFFYGEYTSVNVDTNSWQASIWNNTNFYTNNEDYGFAKIPIIKDKFCIGFSQNTISVFDPGLSQQRMPLGVDLKTIDTTFKFISGGLSLTDVNQIACTDNYRVLAPIVSSDQTKGHFCIFDISVNVNPVYNFSITNTHNLNIGSSVGSVIGTIGNRFIAWSNDSIYLIREDYSVKYISSQTWSAVFQYGTDYYAIEWYTNKILKSSDLGETWTYFSLSNGYPLKFVSLDGKLIAFSGDRIWEVDILQTSLTLKEIINDGLKGKFITAIVKNKNKIWVTTLSGVYFRNYSDFYSFK